MMGIKTWYEDYNLRQYLEDVFIPEARQTGMEMTELATVAGVVIVGLAVTPLKGRAVILGTMVAHADDPYGHTNSCTIIDRDDLSVGIIAETISKLPSTIHEGYGENVPPAVALAEQYLIPAIIAALGHSLPIATNKKE